MTRKTRPVSRSIRLAALTIASESGKAGIAKPMRGMGPEGVFEIALPFWGDAYRVIHPFRKKSTHGIKTPKREIDLIQDRLKRLKEMLR